MVLHWALFLEDAREKCISFVKGTVRMEEESLKNSLVRALKTTTGSFHERGEGHLDTGKRNQKRRIDFWDFLKWLL